MESAVIRAPTRRRARNDEQLYGRIKLKKVLGLTVCSNAALDVSPISGLLAYPAGCTVILFNAKKQTQAYLVNTSRKAITAVAFSRCGRYLATGECGLNPAIKVWELDSPNGNLEDTTGGNVVAEFVGHKQAVSCVAFSPTGKYLVSVGSQLDMIVNVFDWKSNLKMASNKVSAKVSAVSFSEDGSYFVTVGNRHVKYWYLDGGRKYKDPVPLMGRSAILGELRNNDFCAVACGKGEFFDSTYAITRQGHLVEFNSRRLLDKWVACRTTSANCICVNAQFILVGCAESIIRIFNASTLEYVTTLPRTHYLGVDVAAGVHINHIMNVPHNAKYPDCVAMVYDASRAKVSCVYNDHSLYIWDMRDIKRVGKSHSFLYHSTCIWGVETVPYNLERETSQTLPEECFLTCSSDDTIRVWGLENCSNNEIYRKNIYSKDLLKVVYIDEELNFIRDCYNSVMATDKSSYDSRNGVRCMKISPELSHLATGDRSGNIRIYNLANLKMLTIIEAHDSEVLCLEYSNDKIDRKLLASASRDRLIHVFDVNQGYVILQTLDDHSSSITSVKFVGSGLTFQMISCGCDKSIMFRTYQNGQFLRGTNCSGKTTLYDMEVDSNSKHIMTACQDRNIRVYSTQSQKHTKTFKGSHSEDGSLIKLSLDPSGIYLATSSTDKTLSVYDYYSNECMARMYGHSELVTGLAFTNDCKYLISASGDGCVFVWQIPHDMIVTMQARLSQQRLRSGHPPLARPISEIIVESPIPEEEKFGMSPGRMFMDDIPLTPGYKFSDVGQLPQWAKRKTSTTEEPTNAPPSLSSSPSQVVGVPKPRGRWAQRGQIDSDTLDLRSNSESPLGAPPYSGGMVGNTQTSDYNSASSKDIMYNQTYLSEDSSIDSGMETRREIKFAGVTGNGNMRPVPEKKKTSTTVAPSLRFESNNDHDGDVEDISDGERTSSDHGLFYPTISPGTPTEFKVNAMNEEELRKSMRRKNFEKVGLNLSGGSHTASTGTGTGTSDTEDEGSTPSGENADRSIASTLGGSTENIPQVSSSFLQQALDGPGGFPERGDRTRRSISAKHNTEKSPSITKSYTSTKKEELLKVISEAKQKLENGQRNFKNGIIKNNAIPEVGYRPLRGSHSISDLSLAASSETPRTPNRYIKAGYKTQTSSNFFFNCAASKAVLTQNCNVMRQLHQNYPPYPRHIGVYTATTTLTPSSVQIEAKQKSNSSTCPRSKSSSTKSSTNHESVDSSSNYNNNTSQSKSSSQSRKSQSILKNYKSCPVSPVHEEIDWRNLPSNNKNIIFTEPKRHSVYSDDARTILDMIHTDTERMIQEITKKYGDLDEPLTNVLSTSASVPHSLSNTRSLPLPHNHGGGAAKKKDKDSPKDEEGNFSSDSLENCSLDLDYEKNHCNGRKKKVCKKHQKKATTIPKRSVSEYFIYKEFYDQSIHRNVSLSDILNDDPTSQKPNEDHLEEAKFLETQRHSSASFFLTQYPDKKSQESLLSDEFGDVSYYNSMESILSDESDCKSAPLEMLFDKKRLRNPCTHLLHERVMDNVSKSYGSSPNTYSSLDFYMQQKSVNTTYEAFDVSGYGLNEFSEKPRTSSNQPTSIPTIHSSETYPRLSDCLPPKSPTNDDDIPTMKYKNAQYNSGVNKSLSKEFASERQKRNPLTNEEYDDYMFTKKPVGEKPPVPAKPQSLISSVLSGGGAPPPATTTTTPQVSAPPTSVKKSCSFDVDIKDMKVPSRTASVVRKFERNLAKFEREKQQQSMRTSASSGALSSTGSCLKSSQKSLNTDGGASRRASSMRSRSRPKISVRFNTVSQIKYTPCDKRSSSCSSSRSSENRTDYEEKSFEMYISEHGNERDNNMDSLKLYTKPAPLMDEVQDDKSKKNSQNEKTYVLQPSLDNNTSNQCRNIAKKIDIINKLIEMEEKKLEQIRLATENRMKPFECNSKEKGYVKSLTMNFDKLARGIERDIETEQNRVGCGSDGSSEYSKMTRNISLPDVLESVKLQAYNFITSTDNEHESEKIRIDCGGKDKGSNNNKNLMPVQIEDSSIRRACSLSDLHMGNMGKSPKSNGTPAQLQKTGTNHRPSPVSRSVSKRNSLQGPKSPGTSLATQSGSMNVLNNASDSEPEEALRGGSRPSPQSQSRSNGPIAASRQYNNKATTITSSRRKGLQSSFNNGSGQQDDSSSEETPGSSSTHGSKPVVPPRPRNLSLDHKKTVMNSPNVVKSRGNFEPVDFPSRDIDQSDPKSQVYNIINKLYTTTTAAMQLHAKLKNCEDSPTSTGNNNLMLKELENAVIMTQQMLTNITNKNDKNSSQTLSSSFSGNEVNLENGDFLTMVNNCADLLSNVRSKHKPDDCENNS
ncbi:uncharacterized protein LOC129905836 isoform X3 [Episyrphus balteatus]|uniref:uncharacterized protein LOC129905836 isoform X3 n=1 Tax=Episyrphus balteatus TaxID=286459 RepID=UPI0024868A07|nr:uncharacterized protein LOC129905836 isoform X3 [Episyrphus balteatus]